MQQILTDITKPIAEELNLFELEYQKTLSSEDKLLTTILDNILSQKGKRIRPILMFLIAKIYGNITQHTIRMAVVMELLHGASLLHDDVIDNSLLRRNKPTINAIFGNRIAVLAGDFLYGKAIATLETKEDFALLDIFSRIAIDLPQGEIKEAQNTQDKNISIEDYLKVIYYKTSALIVAAVELGGRCCGTNNLDMERLTILGKNIGMAFQIKDDLLDYDLQNKAGKGIGNDIREKKVTLPLIYLLESLSDETKQNTLQMFFSNNQTQEDINYLIALTYQSGSIERAIQTQKKYSIDAMNIIDTLPQNNYTDSLKQLVEFLINRNN